jgi:uncharacterized RDD family membrane protein YckC
MSWFFIDESVTEGDRRQGPYSLDEIYAFVESGKITDDTLVWKSGEADWKPWKETTEAKANADRDELLKNTIDLLLKQSQEKKHYAGFFVRLVAYVIDNLVVSFFCGIAFLVVSQMGLLDLGSLAEQAQAFLDAPTSTEALNNLMDAPGMWDFMFICTILQTIYFLFFTGKFSSTPGKMLFRLRIESAQGEKLNWGLALVRYLASIFTQFTLMLYGLGYIIVCIDPKRRALHDWIARTRVVYKE